MSKIIEYLEQNIRKLIDCKRPSTTKQMCRLQNIRMEIWKCKAVRKYKTRPSKVSTCSFFLLICANIALNYIKQT